MNISNVLSVFGNAGGAGKEKTTATQSYAVDFEKMLKKTVVDSKITEKHTVINSISDIQGLQELQHPLTQLELSVQYMSAIRDKVQGVIDKLTGMQL